MDFTLLDFDEHIEKKLIDSGRNYWLNNSLSPFDYEGNGKWHVVAKDKEFFHIFISLRQGSQNHEIFSCQCGCIRNAFMCSHIVAALFELREFINSGKGLVYAEKIKEEEIKLKQARDILQFKEMFSRYNKQDVDRIVVDYIIRQKSNSNTLIDEILAKAGKNKTGINSDMVYKFMKPIHELVKKAETKYGLNEFSETFFLLQSIIEEITKLIVKIDFMKIKDDGYFDDKSDDDTPVYFIGRKP